MQNKNLLIFTLSFLFLSLQTTGWTLDQQHADALMGQDLNLTAPEVISYQISTGQFALVFTDGLALSFGTNQFSSDSAVVKLKTVTTEFKGKVSVDYDAEVYLEDNISAQEGAKTIRITQSSINQGNALVLAFNVEGEVFVTADKKLTRDPRGMELYSRAQQAFDVAERRRVVEPELRELQIALKPPEPQEPQPPQAEQMQPPEEKTKPAEAEMKKPQIEYPINIAPAGDIAPKIERTSAQTPDGLDVATIIGRFYIWQKQDEKGRLLELQADNAVIFYPGETLKPDRKQQAAVGGNVLPGEKIKGVYLSGDVIMTEGSRTIRAVELYYDFQNKQALAVDAQVRSFDVSRNVPIYVRASRIRQIAENKFAPKDMTLTTSEFHKPQISFEASSVLITDTTTIDEQEGKLSDSSYEALMRDVRFKVYDRTLLYLPYVRSNLQRPDVPLKSVRIGNDSDFGTSLETQWYLSRLLGLRQPEGTDSTLALDYYGERGPGAGVEIEYNRQDYFGKLIGYMVHDTGEDDLGRARTRENLEPPRKFRGRFSWRHRQYLPHDWQLTTGLNYLSDEHFMESYYRSEFNAGVERETYLHLKRIQDNWGVSFLTKWRLNDFADKLEELPTAEFHLTGGSLFDDNFTLYSDTQISRFRQRIGNEHTTDIDEDFFSFVSHRMELDAPLKAGNIQIVPFTAGTFGYDDRSGYTRSLVDGQATGEFGEDKVFIGELGLRAKTQYWKVYPDIESRLWDLHKLRHIIEPELTVVGYGQSDSVVEQRDVLNFGISQRLQTKRGRAEERRIVDWMRLDIDFTWVNNSVGTSDAGPGPDRFIWNKPFVPLRDLSVPGIFHGDLDDEFRKFAMYGPRRNYFSADYLWRISDTTSLLSDVYYDMQSSEVQQLNVGISRMRWPDLTYYIGSRYLKRVQIGREKGSNAFVFAMSYKIDPRYTFILSNQYDFDYAETVRSDMTLMRRYRRIFYALTFSADQSLDRTAIVFSIWPQGVPELAIGDRSYMGISEPAR